MSAGGSGGGPAVGSPASGHSASVTTSAMAESRDACLAGLRQALQRDPDALGLRETMTAAGTRLVDVADELAEVGVDEFLGPDRADMSREDDSSRRSSNGSQGPVASSRMQWSGAARRGQQRLCCGSTQSCARRYGAALPAAGWTRTGSA
jgi:hypothetical protein